MPACFASVLTDFPEQAALIDAALAPETRFRDRLRRRTIYGDAPRAVALARALRAASSDRWDDAQAFLSVADAAPEVVMTPWDRKLYADLRATVQAEAR